MCLVLSFYAFVLSPVGMKLSAPATTAATADKEWLTEERIRMIFTIKFNDTKENDDQSQRI